MKKVILSIIILFFSNYCLASYPIDAVKKKISHLTPIDKSGKYVFKGDDANLRIKFVTAQAIIEDSFAKGLKNKQLKKVVGIIHTPLPSTPLRNDKILNIDTVHKKVYMDKNRAKTVLDRVAVLKNYMNSGGTLIAAHLKRKPIPGIEVYTKLRKKYNNLIDKTVTYLPPTMIGATYIAEDNSGKKYCFSIQASQANAPPEHEAQWAIWLGSMDKPEIKKRFEKVNNFFKEQGIDIQSK